jgi:NADH dehydrogenase
MNDVLLCGGTGMLGGSIARKLAEHGVPFRALVRPRSDASPLRELGADIRVGDLTDRASLDRAVSGATTVITTVTAIRRLLDGAKDVTIEGVDREGGANLVRAAEAAGVQRFVYVSVAGLTDALAARAPVIAAKKATEHLVQASTMRSVIVRPVAFLEMWLSPVTGIDAAKRRAVLFGRGRTPTSYVAVDDVAEACVRLALADDPPAEIVLANAEQLTRREVVDAFEQAYGTRFRRISVPRAVLATGARLTRRVNPAMASVLGMSLNVDVNGLVADAGPLRGLGIEPRSTTDAIAALPRRRTSSA